MQENYATPDLLIARAIELQQSGYIVLVLDQEMGDPWVGYSAFRSRDVQIRDGVPEDSRRLLLDGPVPADLDLRSIYKTAGPSS